MIHRTILEWDTIRYGSADDEMPEHIAGRIAAVAAASSLAGPGRGGVLDHGRKGLRARGVVGVIAAPGGTLEILPKIGMLDSQGGTAVGGIRRRLVHMLAVVLDLRVDEGQLTQLDFQRETLLEIFIRLFSERLADAMRQGMPRRYVHHEDDLPMLRGRLDVTRQFTVLAAQPGRLACRYDALATDIALNRIMKATITRLARLAGTTANRHKLRALAFAYADIAEVPVGALAWGEVVLDRTNARWRALLGLARLLLGGQYQTTSAGSGSGFSLLFEMNVLFEAYVARMLSLALAGTDLRVVSQGGRLYCLSIDDQHGLFQTKPDILVMRGDAVVQVIDTKWKRIANRIDDPKQGVAQADIYQMMAYARLYACDRPTLLYPHHVGITVPEGVIATHRMTGSNSMLSISTLDLADPANPMGRLKNLVLGPPL